MPGFEYLFTLEVELGELVSLGPMSYGEKRVVSILGGSCNGPNLNGRVITGTDWQTLRSDGVLEIDATYVVETSAGQKLRVSNKGLRHGPSEILARLARGENVDASQYFFRSVMRFESGADDLLWLNKVIGVCEAERAGSRVRFKVWRLL